MSAIMTLGGVALAVIGLLIAFAGLPDRAAGLGLGSDLIQAGASLFAGGLIVAALGLVLRALRDIADRVEEAGFGLSAPRPSLNDELTEETPVPLPRAARASAAARSTAPAEDDFAEAAPPRDSRAHRAPREPQPQAAQRTPRNADVQRQQPRSHRQEPDLETYQDDFVDDFPAQRQEPRWMRTQAETNNRQQPAGVIPLQSTNRQSRANPAASVSNQRREQPAPQYDNGAQRRRAAHEPEEMESGELAVVRSGIIAGMAYTLYSDGSIEAELPSGMVRFGSLAELQEHVKRSGADEQEDYRGSNAAQH